MLTNILRWAAIPFVLIASPISSFAGRYEPLVNALVCISAILLLQRAVWLHRYVSGAGFIAIAVMFSPFFLVVRIFLLLVLACIAAFAAVLAGFRMQPSPAICLTP